jgi:sec-independent protein translocase protein TatA
MNIFVLLGMIGPWQIVLIVVVVLLLFGGRKIPELMRGIGKGAHEFKKGLSGDEDEENEEPKKDVTTKEE